MSGQGAATASFPRVPLLVGAGLTLAVLGGAVWFGLQPVLDGQGGDIATSKFDYLRRAAPNEVGDALAGFAGALAFIWIIVTVWLQSIELAEQRKELRAQRREMELQREEMTLQSQEAERQREATQEMARAMRAQADIFEDERKFRSETRAKEHLDVILEHWTRKYSEDVSFDAWNYQVFPSETPEAGHKFPDFIQFIKYRASMRTTSRESLRDFCLELSKAISGYLAPLVAIAKGDRFRYLGVEMEPFGKLRGDRPDNYRLLLADLEEIRAMGELLSFAERARLADCHLDAAIAALQSALAADIWAPEEPTA